MISTRDVSNSARLQCTLPEAAVSMQQFLPLKKAAYAKLAKLPSVVHHRGAAQ
jgi:hypothetical protein